MSLISTPPPSPPPPPPSPPPPPPSAPPPPPSPPAWPHPNLGPILLLSLRMPMLLKEPPELDLLLPPPITTDDEIEVSELKLEVTALLGEVPLGAPVRVDVKLTNTGEIPMLAPRDVGLRSACMTGFVQDASGRVRTFRPLVHCMDSIDTAVLEAGESITGSMTLLRGAEGALFPSSGVSQIIIKSTWDVGDGSVQATVTGKTTVFITDAHESKHAAAAHKILTTPDAHLVLVLGGDYLEEGVEAIQQAVEDKTLGPHYAAIEAKRLAQPYKGRCADCEEAKQLMEQRGVVASRKEKVKLRRLFQEHGHAPGKKQNGT